MAVAPNPRVEAFAESTTPEPTVVSSRPIRVFIPLVTPYLYGMERAVIELFDTLRPGIEPYFLQSRRIFEGEFPIIKEMKRRDFSIELLPDRSDWERLARPRSLKHLVSMLNATLRSNLAILKGARGKDVLYVPGISAASSSLLAAIYCRLTGRRVIHHFHDLGTSNWLFPLWIQLATDFVHNTDFGYQDIAKKIPRIKRKRNVIIPYLIKSRRSEDPMDVDASRLLSGKRNVFFVGQVSLHKGVDLLVRAFTSIARKHRDLTLHLVGGFKNDFRAQLDELIGTAGLSDRVTFWGYRDDVSDLLRSAYLYVQSSPPSRFHDCSPLAVIEAMAEGLPTVCFRSGALPEMVVHEKTGLVCEESVIALADAMNRMLLDSGFRDTCAVAARQRYEELWCPDRIHELWLRFLAR
jgi:glycosyltransferase involved in cell wall biosynthesis